MSCEECDHARATNGLWSRYDSRKCPWCAARLIQRLGQRQISREEVSKRRTEVLKDSVAWGLDEAQIRKLAKGGLALAPQDDDKGAKK